MSNWIKYPLILEGTNVTLVSLEKAHVNELALLAKDHRIWEFFPFDGSNEIRFKSIYLNFIAERKKGNQYPFVIIDKQNSKIIGSTSFLDIHSKHKKLEIGATWLIPDYWNSKINIECKLILLEYCFSRLNAIRVQFKTDENNIRSRKAIEKIGAQLEGIFRNEMIKENLTKRNSVFYSIIDSEWESKKIQLLKILKTKTDENNK